MKRPKRLTRAQKVAASRSGSCASCGHAQRQHTGGAGCLGDDAPGSSCACEEFAPRGPIEATS